VVQDLMGIHDLGVARSHCFDIRSPQRRTIDHDAAAGNEALVPT
jgi:hypothetical protein